MSSRESLLIILLLFIICSSLQAKESPGLEFESSAFSIALHTLQNQINYTFERVDLLRRAMTHSSYSEENNKALSILGERVIETYVALSSLGKDIDITAKDLNNKISEISKVEASCAFDGLRLGLQKVVRVSRKTNSSTPVVVCGTFRAIFGAIAIDKGNSDDAGGVFWNVHGGGRGRAMAMTGRPSPWPTPAGKSANRAVRPSGWASLRYARYTTPCLAQSGAQSFHCLSNTASRRGG